MASYFKYRTLNNFERIVDILINHRLFGSNYHQLNDPMEGHFKDSTNNKLLRKEVYDNLDNTYICSASTSFKNVLLWSHYANGHNGICIEFDVKSEQWKPHKVDYVTDLPNLKRETDYKNLLLCKSSLWKYEDEIRFLKEKTPKSRPYMNISIIHLYIGLKCEHKTLLKKLCKRLNIKVTELKKEDIPFF